MRTARASTLVRRNTEMSTWPTHGERRPDVVPFVLGGQLAGVAMGNFRNAARSGGPLDTGAGAGPPLLPPQAVSTTASTTVAQPRARTDLSKREISACAARPARC